MTEMLPVGLDSDSDLPPPLLRWVRIDDEHPRWQIRVQPGENGHRLITDAAIATYGRKHVEQLLTGLPALPERAWDADSRSAR
jgi:hypothetical protein